MVEGLQVVFPPAEDVEGLLSLTNQSGEAVASIPLRLERWPDYPAFGMLRANGPGIAHLNAGGTYTLSVSLGDDEIASLTYTLMEKASGDPFNPQKTYFRDGPWQRLAYLSAPMEKPDEALRLNYWVSLREIGFDERTSLSLTLHHGNTVKAKSRSDFVASSENWQFFSHPLVKPDGAHHFTLSDLAAQDGAYTITIWAHEKAFKTYNLAVREGIVIPSSDSELSTTPNPEFLTPRRINTSAGSGSRYFMEDVFWIEAQ